MDCVLLFVYIFSIIFVRLINSNANMISMLRIWWSWEYLCGSHIIYGFWNLAYVVTVNYYPSMSKHQYPTSHALKNRYNRQASGTLSLCVMAFPYNILFPCVFCVLFSSAFASEDRIQNQLKHSAPALFVFGDSTVDPGNNNYVGTIFKSDFPPYGEDLRSQLPTGRFSNGKLPTDFIGK